MVSDKQKKELQNYFQHEPVEVVYIYGSYVTGHLHQNSDVDIGILFFKKVNKNDRFDKILKYTGILEKIFPGTRADVVDLNVAPTHLRYSAIAPRQDVFVRDENSRVDFEQQTLSKFYDRQPFLRQHTRISLATIAHEGLMP